MDPPTAVEPTAQQEHDAAGSAVRDAGSVLCDALARRRRLRRRQGRQPRRADRGGLSGPDGFVVGAPAYAEFCDVGGLRGRIEERLQRGRRRRHRRARRGRRRRADHGRGRADPRVGGAGDPRRLRRADRGGRRRRTGRSALVGNRGGHRGSLVRGHERDLPKRSRRRRRGRRRAPLLVIPVWRSNGLLPRQARLRPSRHGHRRRRPAPGARHARRASCSRSTRRAGTPIDS